MNNKILFALLGIIVIAGGIFMIFNSQQSSDTSNGTQETSMEDGLNDDSNMEDTEMTDGSDSPMTNNYQVYSATDFQAHADNRRVLFFHANWCPTCIPVDRELRANSDQIPEGVVVFRVNYNDDDTDQVEKEIARTYGVTYQHTFVQVDENGNEVTKWNGGGLEELIQNLEQ